MKSTLIAVDVAKEVFEVAVSERPGRVTQRHRLSRVGFGRFLARQAAGTIVMEACGTAHFRSRQAHASGHRRLGAATGAADLCPRSTFVKRPAWEVPTWPLVELAEPF